MSAISARIDTFLARSDVQRFNEVSQSILLSAGKVAVAVVAVFAMIAAPACILTVFGLGCAFLAGATTVAVLGGVDLIISSIAISPIAIVAVGLGPAACMWAFEQCKETHQIIWSRT